MPIRLGTQIQDNDWGSLRSTIKEIMRRGTDGTSDRVLKHILANTADSSAIHTTASETNFSLTQTVSTTQYYPGRIFKVSASGVYSTTGTPTLLFKVKIGSTTIVTFTARTGINNASNQSWRVEATIVCRTTGSSGTVMGYGTVYINTATGVDTVETVVNNAATTVNTTTAQALQVSLTWSASSSSNTATMTNFLVMLSDY